jgi:hypothetical protein
VPITRRRRLARPGLCPARDLLRKTDASGPAQARHQECFPWNGSRRRRAKSQKECVAAITVPIIVCVWPLFLSSRPSRQLPLDVSDTDRAARCHSAWPLERRKQCPSAAVQDASHDNDRQPDQSKPSDRRRQPDMRLVAACHRSSLPVDGVVWWWQSPRRCRWCQHITIAHRSRCLNDARTSSQIDYHAHQWRSPSGVRLVCCATTTTSATVTTRAQTLSHRRQGRWLASGSTVMGRPHAAAAQQGRMAEGGNPS